jgi:hypothetical protein
MATIRSRRALGVVLRVAAGAAALSLFVYVPYRYAARPPEFGGFLGSTYALLFPLSLVLAAAALRVAWRPGGLARLGSKRESGSGAWRWAIGLYGGSWLAMGLMCVPSLTALADVSPIQGLFATVHMTAQHVFLGFGAVAAAVRPAALEAVLEGRRVAEVGVESRERGPSPEPEARAG